MGDVNNVAVSPKAKLETFLVALPMQDSMYFAIWETSGITNKMEPRFIIVLKPLF